MPRTIDEPIPGEEWLFMSVSGDNLRGDCVLYGAIDLQGQSVNRARYNPDPNAVILGARGHTAAAGVQVRDLPGPEKSLTEVIYLFHAHDLPEEHNPAHAEVRVHRQNTGWNKNHKPTAENKTWLKELLARQLCVVSRA